MSYAFTLPSPEAALPSLAPHEIVPLLIGATVGEVERELVLQTLARCDGNRTRAARVLGLSVRTLRNKIREYSADGIEVPCCEHAADGRSDRQIDRKTAPARQ
ncbi:helix-turn-helix domain-containing protein [Bradyrhizobium jicamae]|uniref:Helix-turn-helix domain-containing protein n=1 Tax=Bradyrhizobium jicamae TaxID=280332 RepID=A0ABS5FEB1_9BRAD|nr:helix-turn-helix domain-containing protein [Bradyrhizobium jicamae]MBR0795113.1 helix-turn-helix domain-containing protein [Bradyrhizobium jicamae]MBR0931901.1 helix-turn-helix domain-containing protein [Bradyrhizobium jicamae]